MLLALIPCPTWAHDARTVDPRITYLRHFQWIDTAYITPGSTVRTWLRLFAKLRAASYRVYRCHDPHELTTLHRWILGETYLSYFMSYLCMFFTCASQKRINCYRLSYCSYISKWTCRRRRTLVEYRYLSVDVLLKQSVNTRYSTYHTVISVILFTQSKVFYAPPSDERFIFRSGHDLCTW